MWLNLSYFIIAAVTGSLVLHASFSGERYRPGVPPLYAGKLLAEVPPLQRRLWNSTLRAQLVLFGITCVSGVGLAAEWRFQKSPVCHRLRRCRISWELGVMILYWTLLWTRAATPTPLALWVQLTQHATTAVVLWIDLFLGRARLPDRILAILFPAACAYACINAAVSLTVRPVYPILTWRNGPAAAALIIGVFAALVAFYFFASCTACSRDAVCRPRMAPGTGGWFGTDDPRPFNVGPFSADCFGADLRPEPTCASCCRKRALPAGDVLATAFLPASLLPAGDGAAAAVEPEGVAAVAVGV